MSFQLDLSGSESSSDSDEGVSQGSRVVRSVGCTPQEAAYYEGTASLMNSALAFEGETSEMLIQEDSELGTLRGQMRPEDDPKVGAYVAVALGSVQRGTREEWGEAKREAKKKLEAAGKKANAAMVTANNGGFAVFVVMKKGEERGENWFEVKLIGEGSTIRFDREFAQSVHSVEEGHPLLHGAEGGQQDA